MTNQISFFRPEIPEIWIFVPDAYKYHLLVGLILFSLGMAIVQIQKGEALFHHQKVPLGIVSFELAGEESKAREIADFWASRKLTDKAKKSIYWDFGFLLAYGLCLSFICFLASTSWPSPSLGFCLGTVLSLTFILAGIFDAVENLAMLRMISAGQDSMGIFPLLARWCAIPKFGLIIMGLAYILVSWVYWFFKHCSCSPLQ